MCCPLSLGLFFGVVRHSRFKCSGIINIYILYNCVEEVSLQPSGDQRFQSTMFLLEFYLLPMLRDCAMLSACPPLKSDPLCHRAACNLCLRTSSDLNRYDMIPLREVDVLPNESHATKCHPLEDPASKCIRR